MSEDTPDHLSNEGLVESVPDVILTADPETGEIVDAEGGVEALFGYSPTDLIGHNHTDLHPPDERAAYAELFEKHLQAEPSLIAEFDDGSPVYVHTASGDTVPVEINAWTTESDGRTRFKAVFRALSGQMQREREHSQYRKAVESAVDPIAAIDTSYRYLFSNEAYCDPLEYQPTDIVGTTVEEVLGPDVFESVKPYIDAGLNGETSQHELTREYPSGEVREFEATYSPLRTADGEIYGLLGSLNDVTERKQRERELERLFDGMEDAAFVHDLSGQFQVVNETAVERYGYTESEFLSMSPRELDTEEEAEKVGDRIDQIREEGPVVFETVHQSKTGELTPVEISSSHIQYKGEPAILSIARDISQRRESERKFRVLFNNASDAIVQTEFKDGEPTVRAINPAFEDQFGFEEDDLVGRPLTEVFDTSTTGYGMTEINRRIRQEKYLHMEIQRRTPEGTRDFLLRSIPIDPEAGEYYRVYTDITERKERERTLVRQRDELQTLNRLNELILSIIEELVTADSRADIEATVCQELAESPLFEFAWIGEQDHETDRTKMRTCSGTESEFAEITGYDPEGADSEFGPVEQALTTGEIQVVQNTGVDPRFIDPSNPGGTQEVKSIAVVPLFDSDAVYASIVIYAPREYAFTGREMAGLETLGKIVEFAINAIRNRKLLTTDTVTEVEFDVSGSGLPLVQIAGAVGCQIELGGYVASGSADGVTLYLDIAGSPPAAFLDEARSDPNVLRASQLTDATEDGYRVSITVDCELFRILQDRHKGRIRTIELDAGDGRYVFEVPLTEDTRDIVKLVNSEYPGVAFSAKREREFSMDDPGNVGMELESELTDRQREVLKNALLAGYFEWPRDSTAEDIAESIDITSSTLQYHLRNAQKQVFSRFFGPDS